ncbi:Crp/Fnr family transcriptional regulator [Acidiphilium sp. MT5]
MLQQPKATPPMPTAAASPAPPAPPRLLPQAALSSHQAKKLGQIAQLDHFAPGDYLFHVGQPVQALFNIISGVAKLIAEPADHRPVVIGFAFSHDSLGQFSPPAYTRSAQAITQLTAYTLPHDRLNHLLTADTSLHQRLLNQFCANLRATQAHLLTRRAPPPQRIAAFLLCLHERTTPDPQDPTLLIIPMRRIDIADFLALSTASLRRILGWFQTSQWIEHLSAHRIRILNPQALTRLAAGSPPNPHPTQGAAS